MVVLTFKESIYKVQISTFFRIKVPYAKFTYENTIRKTQQMAL
ncbi:conserved hypothetical protein [Leptospira interrogans serovar Manilae]|uniref:Uncharacterized protein n=1 Tax=Leptospira interrogans serovar Manilae TaxID=214675 RepID=A0AAQ1SNZ6_LEPIR|nr:conserved hypothetical protein [Leptospira interrogans serovar Manilae]